MAENKNMLAFDFGNSTLRAILCRFDGEKIESEVVLSESNEMLKIDDYFYWDLLRIFSFMKRMASFFRISYSSLGYMLGLKK